MYDSEFYTLNFFVYHMEFLILILYFMVS